MEWDYELFSQYKFWGLGWYFYEEENFPNGKMWGSSHYPQLMEKQRQIGRMILGAAKDREGAPPQREREVK